MHQILHVVNIYFVLPYFIGDQFLFLKGKGHKVHVICSPSSYLEDYANKMQFDYLEVEITRAIKPIKDINVLLRICLYIKRNKIDVVVGHTPKGALLAMIAGWIMRVPKRIYFRHGLVYETMEGFQRELVKYLDRLTAYCSTKVVCVSPSLYARSLDDHLNPEKKQTILGKGTCGGIDAVNKFNPEKINSLKLDHLRESLLIKPSDFVIGYCGRLVIDKGIVELVDAFSLLNKKSIGEPKLLLVGDFEERNSLPIHVIEKIRNARNIITTGFIFKDIEYYYALMDIFILPSFREGFGISVLEASAMQIPVLTTQATGCIDSIIAGETGLYVSNTKESILDGIQSLLDDKNIPRFGLKGREFVLSNFDNRILWPIIEKELYD
jgi:glycosyltransferase involved in cell wall biosynthesis